MKFKHVTVKDQYYSNDVKMRNITEIRKTQRQKFIKWVYIRVLECIVLKIIVMR